MLPDADSPSQPETDEQIVARIEKALKGNALALAVQEALRGKLRQYIGQPNSRFLQTTIASGIKQVLMKFAPEVALGEVVIEPSVEDPTELQIRLRFDCFGGRFFDL